MSVQDVFTLLVGGIVAWYVVPVLLVLGVFVIVGLGAIVVDIFSSRDA